MIIAIFINLILLIFGTLMSWLPDGTTLPTIGNVNLDTIMQTGFGYFHFLVSIFPPLGTVATAASIYLGFKLVMIILKVILGSRQPTAH